MVRPVLVVLLLALPGMVRAETYVSPMLGFFEAGVICSRGYRDTIPSPDMIAGEAYVVLETPEIISHSRVVPAVPGMGFGVFTASKGDAIAGVELRIYHPPMGPEGLTTQHRQGMIVPAGEQGYRGYVFDFDYELLPGAWRIAAYLDGEPVYEVDYTVVPPADAPDLAARCSLSELLG